MKNRTSTSSPSRTRRFAAAFASIATLVTASIPSFAAPSISAGSGGNYTENASATVVAPGFTASGGAPYVNGHLQFAISSAASTETLALTTVSSANTTSGAVSVVGSTIYLGNGTTADAIGAVDATANGVAGQALKINFATSAFANSSFEDGTTNGWSVSNSRVIINGSNTIAGWTIPSDASPTPSNGSQTSAGDASSGSATFSHSISSNVASGGVNGTKSLSLTLSGSVNPGGGVIRGPYAVSASSFPITAGDSVSFWWSAVAAGDAYDVFGYLLNVDNGQTQILVNATGASGAATQAWTKATVVVAQTGNYKFVFVSGSFDYSFGTALGASLLIDNVQIISGSSAVNDSVVQALARLVTYQNSSANPPASRTIAISTTNTAGESASVNQTIAIAPVNNAPSVAGLGALNYTWNAAAAAISPALTLADADDTSLASAQVAITANFVAGDMLAFANDGLTMGSISGSYDASTGALNLSGTATLAQYQAALRAVTFASNGASIATRTLSFNVVDANASGTSAQTGSATATVSLATTPPSITSAGVASASYGGSFNYAITASTTVPITGYSASGLPAGLSVNTSTGVISGTPTQRGSFNVSLGATNAAGTGTGSLTLTVAQGVATVALGNLSQTYTGSPLSITVTTSPASLATTVTYDGSSIAPTNAGSYSIVANVADANYTGSATGTLVIAKASQTITFAPIGAVAVGSPVALTASASSTLPVTFSIVSGNATLSGGMLTVHNAEPVVVRASQSGSSNFNAATPIDRAVSNAERLSQTISFAELADKKATDAPFALNATASSGLPVKFAIVSGPAMLGGQTVTLTGAAGTVVVRASQEGDAVYAAAPNIERSFHVGAVGPQVFFGQTDTGDALAASLQQDGRAGVLIGYLASTGEGFVVDVTPGSAGTFSAQATVISGGTPAGASATELDLGEPPVAAASTRTFTGVVRDGVISGTIAELGLSFTAFLQPPSGPTADLAGYYTASSTQTVTGSTYAVVGTEGKVYVLAVTASSVASGNGALSGGSFSVTSANGTTIRGSVNSATTEVTGTIATPDGVTDSFAGTSSTTARTDRLVVLSSRGRVGADGSNALIAGFVISGPESKRVLLRAIGPALREFGVSDVLADPKLSLFSAEGNLIAENNDWSGSELVATMKQVGAFALAHGSDDAALLITLPPGAYTMHVTGGTGVALAEIYDASVNPQAEYQRLVDISSRGNVASGEGVLIGGFVVTGNRPKRVLVRGVGPALAQWGLNSVLTNPVLRLYDRRGEVIARNDDWETPVTVIAGQTSASADEIADAARTTGAFALSRGSKDASLIITLAPGLYTAHVAGNEATAGVGLIEIYELP